MTKEGPVSLKCPHCSFETDKPNLLVGRDQQARAEQRFMQDMSSFVGGVFVCPSGHRSTMRTKCSQCGWVGVAKPPLKYSLFTPLAVVDAFRNRMEVGYPACRHKGTAGVDFEQVLVRIAGK
jgi:hypothetical protein